MQPYQAVKAYRCPGCDHEIPPGLGHEVVVPARRARGTAALAHRRAGGASNRGTSGTRRARTRLRSRRSTGGAPRSASTDATSKRSSRARALRVLRRATRMASVRNRRCLVHVTASAGVPKAVLRAGLHLAEHEHAAAPDARGRARPRGSASCGRARRSPRSTYQRADQRPRRVAERPPGDPAAGSRQAHVVPASSSMLTSLNVTTRTLATKRAGPVHVPDPRVLQLELEVGRGRPRCCTSMLHLVGEVEAPLGLDDVREHRQDVAVLLVELELDLGLVPLEILGAHTDHSPNRCPYCNDGRLRCASRSVALLLDLRGLPDPVAQVVELGPAHVAAGDDLDLGQDRRVHREGALDADAEAHLADGEGLAACRRPGGG